MFHNNRRVLLAGPARTRGWAALALALLLAGGLSVAAGQRASAAAFVDAGLGDVAAEKKVVVANPQPVQLLFQFDTKGAPNLQATKFVKQVVVDTVKASGVFSEVSEGPTANGAILNVVIDNVVDDAEMKAAVGSGFATGLTLGLAGTTARDHYNCTVEYVGGPSAAKITRTAQHAILIQLGLINSTPPNAVKVEGGTKGAVFTMTRQIVANPLNALAADPAFSSAGGPAPPVETATSPAAPATESAVPTPGAPGPSPVPAAQP